MSKEKVQEEISGGLEINLLESRFGIPLSEKLQATGLPKGTRGKAQLTLVPRQIFYAIAAVREYGNRKYRAENKPDNWKQNPKKDFQDAALRHLFAYLDNNNSIDEESGIPHLHHLACNIAFLIEGGFAEDKIKTDTSFTVFTDFVKIASDNRLYLFLNDSTLQIDITDDKDLIAELLFAYYKTVQSPHNEKKIAEELYNVWVAHEAKGGKDE